MPRHHLTKCQVVSCPQQWESQHRREPSYRLPVRLPPPCRQPPEAPLRPFFSHPSRHLLAHRRREERHRESGAPETTILKWAGRQALDLFVAYGDIPVPLEAY